MTCPSLLLPRCPNSATSVAKSGVSKVVSGSTSALYSITNTPYLGTEDKDLSKYFYFIIATHYLTRSLRQISLLSLDSSTSSQLSSLSLHLVVKSRPAKQRPTSSMCLVHSKTRCGTGPEEMPENENNHDSKCSTVASCCAVVHVFWEKWLV